VPRWARLTARPSIAGRERLGQAINQSFLVQLALSMTFVAVAALLYMAQAGQVSVQQININTLTGERMNLVAANTRYRAISTTLQSAQRIDTGATQLHMTAPPPSSVLWLNPVVPQVAPIRPVNADALSAQRASQPLAWMEHAVAFVRSSL
jgi:hypothetical protein